MDGPLFARPIIHASARRNISKHFPKLFIILVIYNFEFCEHFAKSLRPSICYEIDKLKYVPTYLITFICT